MAYMWHSDLKQTFFRVLSCGAIAATVLCESASSQQLDDDAFFMDEVYPILEATCLRCHNEEKQRGGLRLDSRAAVLRGGDEGEVVVLGAIEESRLVQAIRRDGDLEMPPKKALDPVSVEILTEWVHRGVPWPQQFATFPATVSGAKPVTAKKVPQVSFAIERGDALDFDRDIRPLISDNCYACHGPDAETRKAGLRLDLLDAATGALPSGHTAVVPGNLEESQLFQRIAAEDPEDRMPPEDHRKKLSADEIERLGRWILQGAPWKEHWAFSETARPAPPEIPDDTWSRTSIDRFVLRKLQAEGLSPAPEADRRTLIRRLSFDLTGLPPTREEVGAFLADAAPDAYGRVVDRLLASPRYGEHRARYWLDAARYADTNGYHIDNMRFMWPWRDWVIRAFNENKPFDVFTVEQLAGDLLPDATLDQRVATGFNRNHMINFEGGAIAEEYRVQYVMDRVDTTATVWMGLTVHCAQCHDHKFDPITQKEFYQFSAFFNSVAEEGLDGNEGNADPYIAVPDAEQTATLHQFEDRLAALRDRLEPTPELENAYETWLNETAPRFRDRWTTLTPTQTSSTGNADMTVLPDASVLASGPNPEQDTYDVVLETSETALTALRIEALQDESLPNRGPGRAENANFVLTDIELEAAPLDDPDDTTFINFVRAYADHDQEGLTIAMAIDDDPESGWSAEGMNYPEPRTAIFIAEKPFGFKGGTRLTVRLHFRSKYEQRAMGRFRVSVTEAPEHAPSAIGDGYAAGPFAGKISQKVFEKRYAPEKRIDLDERYRDDRLKWTPYTLPSSQENAVTLSSEPAAFYVYREIVAPTQRSMTVRIASAQRMRVTVNGAVVHEDKRVPRDDETVRSLELPLRKGSNDFLVKLVSRRGDFALSFDRTGEITDGVSPELQLALAEPREKRRQRQRDALREYYLTRYHPPHNRQRRQEDSLESRIADLKKAMPTSMVMAELEAPRPTYLLERGQYDQPREEVLPGTPAFLPPMDATAPATRLTLARWLVDPGNPLTARVAVNRFWQQFFGEGIVNTSENFGTQGAPPSHPELLDWLATRFVDSGWDMKELIRLIVTSATYRQSARPSPAALEQDPTNRLYARGPRFRMDAEMLRDNALAVSGLLVETLGGPSVYPYQPEGLWKAVAYGGTRFSAQTFKPSTGDGLYRRSLYTFWKRTSPPPSMMLFDAPNRETCSVRRPRSNTPMQALALMNDPQFVEASRAFAERILREGGDATDARIAYAFETTTARLPDPEEIRVLRSLYEAQRAAFTGDPVSARALLDVGDTEPDPDLDPVELAAWTTIANTVLNLDETVTKS